MTAGRRALFALAVEISRNTVIDVYERTIIVTRFSRYLPPLASIWCISVMGALLLPDAVGQLILSDDMSVEGNWQYSHFGGTARPDSSANPDLDTTDAEFGFDYSSFGIPEAPNSEPGDSPTSGLWLSNSAGTFADDPITAVYEDARFTGHYTVQVDMWMNWASTEQGSGVGTTEHSGLFVGFDLDDAQNSFTPGRNGAGMLADTDGDCGNCDYILFKDNAELDTFSGQYSVVDFGFGNQQGYDNRDFNDDAANGELIDLPATFPSFDIGAATNNQQASGEQPAGAAGFQWVTLTAEVMTDAPGNGSNGSIGTAKFSITNPANGTTVVIGTVDNSVDDDPDDGIATNEQPVNMSGGIGLVQFDDFGGPANPPQHGFTIFDNVRVRLGPPPVVDREPDGDVDGRDFVDIQIEDPALIGQWQQEYGTGTGAGIAAVPEPSTIVLLLVASGVARLRRRPTNA